MPLRMKHLVSVFEMSFSVRLFVVILLTAVLFSFTFTTYAATYPADQCAADRKGSNLNCNANDVSITGMAVVGDTTSCIGDTNVTLDLQMTVNFAVPDRYDIGIFISNDGKTPQTKAANGGAASCTVSVLPTASPFLDLDGGATGDICGDGNGTIGGGTGSGIHYMPNVTVPCQSLNGAGGNLYIPFVVSWDNNKTPPGDVCTSNLNPVPNTTSKCNSPTVTQGSVAVVVLPSITMTDGITTIFSGDSTNYTVTITNTTGVSLSNAVFKDPAVTGIAVNSLSCVAAGGASCPVSSTVADMQGAGITIPTLPSDGSVTYTINATLTGNQSDTRTNQASVSVGSQSNSASDTDTIVGAIAILPSTLAKNSDKGTVVTYNYTVYNYGVSTDIISLSALSSQNWTVGLSSSLVSVPAGDSENITVTVNIPNSAAVGTVDTTTITAVSGNNPSKTATATAVTSVTTVLTLTPSNTGAGGAGSYVYYSHRVQSNASTNKTVSLVSTFTSGSCSGWTSALFESNKTTSLTSPITLGAYGDYKDFVVKVNIPAGATISSTCTATLTAAYTSGAANTVSVTDITTVKNLILYEDPGYTAEQYTYPAGNNVYAKTYGLTNGTPYYYKWYAPDGTLMQTSPVTSNLVTLPDTYSIPNAGPLGTWTVQVWNSSTNSIFEQSNFYVGPDHLNASYTGIQPAINTDTVIDLALHDKVNHVVPFDVSGNLVKGNPTDIEGSLMITVTVSGSAQIISTTLTNATITGQSVTGKLDATLGTATLTIRDSVGETVTITPVSYKSVLYGSPVRDEPTTVTYLLAPPTVTKSFSVPAIGVNGTSTQSITIINPNTVAMYGLAFTDTYPANLQNAGTPALSNTCGGTVTGTAAGNSVLSLSGGSLTSGSSCTITVDVTSTAVGSYLNSTGVVSSTNAGSGTAATATLTVMSISSNFNAFETSTAANAISGSIYTKLAGTAFDLDVVAIAANSTQDTGFSGNVKVELLANTGTVGSGYGTDNCPASSVVIQTVASTAISGGRSTVNFTAVPASYQDVRVRISYPTSSPTSIICSTDSFAIRPQQFTLATAATADADNTGTSTIAVPVIKAGTSFTLTATAVAGYNGTPQIDLTKLSAHTGATSTGELGGSFGAADSLTGMASGSAFTYTEVGYFLLHANGVYDDTFSVGVDSSGVDCSADFSNTSIGGKYGCKFGNTVATRYFGRFSPDHFAITPVTFSAACTTHPAASVGYTPTDFTYFGQDGFTTVFTLTAQNGSNATTLNYVGDGTTSWAKLPLTTWGGAPASAGSPGYGFAVSAWSLSQPTGAAIAASSTVPTATNSNTWVSGSTTVTARHKITRPNNPAAPTTATVSALPVDSDGVTMTIATSVGSSEQRFGILHIDNSYGSELLDLPVPIEAQYWNGSYYTLNTDDSCTFFPASSITMNNYLQSLNACETHFSPAGNLTMSGGVISSGLTLTAPGSGNTGSVDLTLNIGSSAGGNTCTSAVEGSATPAGMDWFGINPTARATFGIYEGNSHFIYIRELY